MRPERRRDLEEAGVAIERGRRRESQHYRTAVVRRALLWAMAGMVLFAVLLALLANR